MAVRRLAAAACVLACAFACAPAPAAPVGPLARAGRWIVDAHGRVVIVHGLNVVDKLPPYYPAAVGFDGDDAAFLAREGFDTMRVGWIWKGFEPRPGRYDYRYLRRFAATVRALEARGIWVLIDFHQDQLNERYDGEGFPDWALEDDGLARKPDLGFPGNYTHMPALQRAFDHFWANDFSPGGIAVQDHLIGAWRRLAHLFAHDPRLLGYDLFNEPFPGTGWRPCQRAPGCPAFDAQLNDFNQRAIAAIRHVDGTHLIWLEAQLLSSVCRRLDLGPAGDALAGFSFHDYCGNRPALFGNAERQAAASGTTLLLSEFGSTDDLSSLAATMTAADRHLVSWQAWSYFSREVCCDRPSERLIIDPRLPPAGANLKQSKLAILARPYPEAVAGTPLAMGFDRMRHVFALDYSTAPAGQPLT